jgi:hypothetical protein
MSPRSGRGEFREGRRAGRRLCIISFPPSRWSRRPAVRAVTGRASFLRKRSSRQNKDGEQFASPLLVHSPKSGGMEQDEQGRQTGKSPTIRDF